MNVYDIDYETRSPINLGDKKNSPGAFVYIEHPDARILLCAISKNAGAVLLWDAYASEEANAPALALIREAMTDPEAELWAHNALFEIAVTNTRLKLDLGIDPPSLNRWRCTAALCRAASVPWSLERGAAAVLAGGVRKDSKGEALIDAFCTPLEDGSFREPSGGKELVWADKQLTPSQPVLPAALFQSIATGRGAAADHLTLIDQAHPRLKRPSVARLTKILEMATKYVAEATSQLQDIQIEGTAVPIPRAWQLFREYCRQDVVTQVALRQTLAPDFAPQGWLLDSFLSDLAINVLGFPVNLGAVRNARKLLEENAAVLETQFTALTGGLTATQRDRFLTWARARGYKGLDLQAETVETELARLEEECPETDLYQALLIRSQLSFAALAKLPKMELMGGGSVERVRGGFTWFGAHTGRDTAGGVQPQNLRKPDADIPSDEAYRMICAGASRVEFQFEAVAGDIPAFTDIHRVVAACTRHFIQEPDCGMFSCDFSSIEAITTPWLTGQTDKVELYAGGGEVYCAIGAALFGLQVADVIAGYKAKDKAMTLVRAAGKVAELACQFRGGVSAVETFCRTMRIKLTTKQMEDLVTAFRRNNPATVKAWTAYEDAAMAALAVPGQRFSHRNVAFEAKTLGGIPYLRMILPSGRALHYPRPKVEWMRIKFVRGKKSGAPTVLGYCPTADQITQLKALTPSDQRIVDAERAQATARGEDYRPSIYYAVKAQLTYWGQLTNNAWGMVATHGGKLLENATQATAGDFFHTAVPALHRAGIDITLKVHDEVCGPLRPGQTPEQIEEIMSRRPDWAAGFPLKAVAAAVPWYTK